MKLLHTADVHLGMTTFAQPGKPFSRLTDLDAVLNRFCGVAKRENVDLAIIVGDLFDSRHPKPREGAIATRFLSQLSLICPWVLIDGNHDGKWVISDPGSATLRMLQEFPWENGTVITDPGITSISLRDGSRVHVVSVPYPHKRAFDVSRPDVPAEERHALLALSLEGVINTFRVQADQEAHDDEPIVFAGHLTAVGSVAGSERTMRLEDDVEVGSHVLDLYDYGALGHIHRQQRVGRRAYYPGAPEYVDFGEAGQSKGFLLADVRRGQEPEVTVIDSQPRPLVTYENEPGDSGALYDPPADMPAGAIVRIRLHFPDRSAAAASRATEAAFYAAGASYVQTEIVVPDRAAPSERALDKASTPTDALTAYCRHLGLEPAAYLAAFMELVGPPA